MPATVEAHGPGASFRQVETLLVVTEVQRIGAEDGAEIFAVRMGGLRARRSLSSAASSTPGRAAAGPVRLFRRLHRCVWPTGGGVDRVEYEKVVEERDELAKKMDALESEKENPQQRA